MLHDIHGRICRKVGNRYFAMPKLNQTLTDKFAARSASAIGGKSWQRNVESQTGRARVISNQR